MGRGDASNRVSDGFGGGVEIVRGDGGVARGALGGGGGAAFLALGEDLAAHLVRLGAAGGGAGRGGARRGGRGAGRAGRTAGRRAALLRSLQRGEAGSLARVVVSLGAEGLPLALE